MRDYISILRLDHWIKNIFVLPGALIAIIIFNLDLSINLFLNIIIATLAASFIASANYAINEWLDRDFDALHPGKQDRPAVMGKVSAFGVYTLYLMMIAIGLFIGSKVNMYVLFSLIIFIVSGIAYNVKPFRAKDLILFDVIVESINNPIRMFIGWFAVVDNALIPLSLLIFYWFLGAFMMNAKRLSEWKKFNSKQERIMYRPSLGNYDEHMLIIICFIYAILSSTSLALFAARYKFELVLWLPFFILILAWYFRSALGMSGLTENPEKLLTSKWLLLLLAFNVLVFIFLLSVNFEFLHVIFYESFIIN
jgi:decaprenyl-phosphate phosphoribosyltransferase